MPWGRLDDSLYDHPKLDMLGPQRLPCVGLWVLALSWANRRLSDGFIPTERIKRLGGNTGLADRLVTAGLFDRAEGGFQIHDYLAFNESREDVEHRRAQERERWRRRRADQASSGSRVESRAESGATTDQHRDTRARIPGHTRHFQTRPSDVRDAQKMTTEEYEADLRAKIAAKTGVSA